MSAPPILRGICGRYSDGPWLPHRAYVIHAGRWYRVWRPGRLYDRLAGRRGVYVCRLPPTHPKTIVRQARTVMREVTWDKAEPSRLKPSVRSRAAQRLFARVRRTGELWPVEVPGVELGHRFVLDRYEEI